MASPIQEFIAWAKALTHFAPNRSFEMGRRSRVDRKVKTTLEGTLLSSAIQLLPRFRMPISRRRYYEHWFGPSAQIAIHGSTYQTGNLLTVPGTTCQVNDLNLQNSKSEQNEWFRLQTLGQTALKTRVKEVKERNTLTPEDLESGAGAKSSSAPTTSNSPRRTSTRPRSTRSARSSSKPAERSSRWASPKSSRR